jgi:hypothetical protein
MVRPHSPMSESGPIDLLGIPGEELVEPQPRWADVGFGEARQLPRILLPRTSVNRSLKVGC